jgi:hypothetical protein
MRIRDPRWKKMIRDPDKHTGSATLIKTTKDEEDRKSETDLDEVVLPVEDVDEAEDEDGGHVEGQRDQEHEEVPVVTSP